MITTQLICHPNTRCRMVDNILSEVQWLSDHRVQLCYKLTGAISKLIIPSKQQTAAADGLWQHTCFEVFIADINQENYFELNLSPSTQWAAYAFSDYRQKIPYTANKSPEINIIQSNTQLTLTATIDLPPDLIGKSIHLGLTAVVENINNDLSYWALFHPANEPDFHHRDGFILPLNPF